MEQVSATIENDGAFSNAIASFLVHFDREFGNPKCRQSVNA